MPAARIVVIGGGISGLAAAWQLSKHADVEVRVLEASDQFGGKLRTSEFHGKPVDTGADAFLARVPEAIELCHELGLEDRLVSPAKSNAMVWSRGELHPFPKTTVLGIPYDFDELKATGIISDEGIQRARQELDLREDIGRENTDVSLGHLVAARFGDEVRDRLVDPLVGGINAGSVDGLGVASAVPQIAALSEANSSLYVAAAAQALSREKSSGPVFFAPAEGMQVIVDALVEQLNERGAMLHTHDGVYAIANRDDQWFVTTDNDVMTADAIVIATPALQAAELLHNIQPVTADLLQGVQYASVAMIRLAYPAPAVGASLDASGFVVPGVEHTLVTACSYASSKWAELSSPDTVILRASAGRHGSDRAMRMTDEELIEAVHEELSLMLQINDRYSEADVTRWENALPQYQPGHMGRMGIAQAAMAPLKTVALAGASYAGIGVPTCIRSGYEAAAYISSALELGNDHA